MSTSSDIVPIFSSSFALLFLIPSVYPLSFNLTNIRPPQSSYINLTGKAYISSEGIQVTPDERGANLSKTMGRATYIEPLHLWDSVSGNLSDFSTYFSLVIDSSGSIDLADGLTFFLAPNGSNIMPLSFGGNLAIGNGAPVNASSETFVAVEFDTFQNTWDPSDLPHVGIDINSMRSVVTQRWLNNITQGAQNDVWISYNGSSMTLKVDFTGFSENQRWLQSLSHVVDLRKFLPEYVTFGFSAATGDLFEKHNVKSWEFSSSSLPVDVRSDHVPNVSSQVPAPSPDLSAMGKTRGRKEKNKGLVLGLSFGLSALILASVFASSCLWRRKKSKEEPFGGDEGFFDPSMDNEFEKGTGPKRFSYSELVLATNSFAEEEKLGEGGFGGVYRGFLRETNSYVAVKRVSRGSKQGVKEYASEVKIISQLRHRNLVQLLGWCHQRGELMLVYELMPNGSLDSHLFKEKSPILSWEKRYKIAQGLASALLYLHEEWEQCVVHRDIKASNIMLDSNFNAKLGDFGLARLVDHEKGSQTTVLAGTIGYMAPECVVTGRSSKESDVYSFGVVLLEIATGRRPVNHLVNGVVMTLVEWIWSLHGTRELFHGADPRLETKYDAQEMERLMVIGLWCVHPDCSQRPSIRQTIHVLNFESDLPSLPPVMPAASYPRIHSISSNVSDSSSYNHYSNSSNVTTSTSSASSAAALLHTS